MEGSRGNGYAGMMTPKTLQALETRLERLLRDLTEPMGRREQRQWVQVCIQGLLLDGERKSIEPLNRSPAASLEPMCTPCGR